MKKSTYYIILFVTFANILLSVNSEPSRTITRYYKIDCDLFCRASRFHGIIGGCRCGYILFVKRSNNNYDNKQSKGSSLHPFARWFDNQS